MAQISDVEEQRSIETYGPSWHKTAKSGQFLLPNDAAFASFSQLGPKNKAAQQFPQILIHRSSTTSEESERHNEDDEVTEKEGTFGPKIGIGLTFGPTKELANSSSTSSESSWTTAEDVEGQTFAEADEDGIGTKERKISTISGRMKTIQTLMMVGRGAAVFCGKRAPGQSGTVMAQWATAPNGPTAMENDGEGGDEKGTPDGAIGAGQFEGNEKGQRPFGTIEWKRAPIWHRLAKFYRLFGIRHFLLVMVLALYSVFGGLLFQAIEKDNEYVNLRKNKEALEEMIEQLARNLTVLLNVYASEGQRTAMEQLITKNYQTMLRIEGKYIGSVFHKYEHIVFHLSWCFESSVFYAMTLFTTIGYGTIACQTPLGRIVSIFYALFGIPLMLVVLSDIGQHLLRFLSFCYNRTRCMISVWLRSMAFRILEIDEEAAQVAKEKVEQKQHQLQQNSKKAAQSNFDFATDAELVLISSSSDQEEGVEGNRDAADRSSSSATASDGTFFADQSAASTDGLPLFVSVPLVLLYLCFIALVVSCFDWVDQRTGDDGQSLSFFEAFYFAFISLSTIGLGDLMPNCIEFSPFLALLFLGGLALLSVVNLAIYQHIQRLFLFLFDHLEAFLEDISSAENAQNNANFVFTSLMPNIQLLALALPIFSDDEKSKAPKETTAAAELLHVRRMFSVSRAPSLLHSGNYQWRKGTRSRAFSIAKSDGHPYNQQHTMSSAHQRLTYHTVHGTDFRPTLGILSTAPPSPARSRGPSIRSRRTSAHKIPGSPASVRPCRKRAVTIGCHFDYGADGMGIGGTANVGTRQKLSRHKSTSTVWRRTAKSIETISTNSPTKRARNLAENEAKSEGNYGIELRREEIGTTAERDDDEAKGPTERRICFKKEIAESGASPSAAVAAPHRNIRRTHSERVSQRRRQSHGGAQLYVIDETEPHQQTIAGGERLLRLRRLRTHRLRQIVPQLRQAQSEHGTEPSATAQAGDSGDTRRQQRGGDGGSAATSPSSPRRVHIRTEPTPSAD